jgi:hypothetical protein
VVNVDHNGYLSVKNMACLLAEAHETSFSCVACKAAISRDVSHARTNNGAYKKEPEMLAMSVQLLLSNEWVFYTCNADTDAGLPAYDKGPV